MGVVGVFHFLCPPLGTKEDQKINSALIIHTEPMALFKYAQPREQTQG